MIQIENMLIILVDEKRLDRWQFMQIGNILKFFMEQEKPIPIQSKILLPQVAKTSVIVALACR